MSIRDEITKIICVYKDTSEAYRLEPCPDCGEVANQILTIPQIAKCLELLEKAKCQNCYGTGNVVTTLKGIRETRKEWVCPACKGTGQRYKIALVDTKTELPDNEAWHKVEREFEAYCAGKNEGLGAGFTAKIIEVMECL